MTEMFREYLTHRDRGHSHHAALLALARRLDLDKQTLHRVINRAQADEARFERKEANA